MKYRLVFPIVLILLCFPFLVLAQQPQSPGDRPSQDRPPQQPQAPRSQQQMRITGRVMFPPGLRTLPELTTVTLTSFVGGLRQIEMVRNDGSFEFRNLPGNLPSGNYTLTLNCPGFEPSEQPFQIDRTFGNAQQYVMINLGRPLENDESLPGQGGAVVSARNLAVPEKAWRELARAEKESSRNRPEKAIEHLEKALEIYPEFDQAYNYLALEYVRLGRKEEAFQALHRAIEIGPEEPLSHYNLGLLHLRSGEFVKAVPPFRESLKLDPNQSKAHILLGESYLYLNQYQLALGSFQKAQQLGSTDPMIHLGSGQCFLALQDADNALKHLRLFLKAESKGERAERVRQVVDSLEQSP